MAGHKKDHCAIFKLYRQEKILPKYFRKRGGKKVTVFNSAKMNRHGALNYISERSSGTVVLEY